MGATLTEENHSSREGQDRAEPSNATDPLTSPHDRPPFAGVRYGLLNDGLACGDTAADGDLCAVSRLR